MKYNFLVGTVRPNMREFRQNNIELHIGSFNDLHVQVEITDENVIEATEPDAVGYSRTVISLAGLREISDQFDLMFVGNIPSNEVESGEDNWQDDPDADVWEAIDGIKDEDHDEFESDNDEDEW